MRAGVAFAAGEDLRTELSHKFTRDGIERELAAAGPLPEHWWQDAGNLFANAVAVLA